MLTGLIPAFVTDIEGGTRTTHNAQFRAMWLLIVGLAALFAFGLLLLGYVIPAFREPSWRKLLKVRESKRR